MSILIGAGSASAAKNICVGTDLTNACPAGSTAVADLTAAVTAATDGTLNTIYVNSGNYSSVAGVNFLNAPIKILGVGDTRPVLSVTVPAPGLSVLTSLNSQSSIDNIAISIPTSVGMTGILTANGGQKLSNIDVSGPSASGATGIVMSDATPQIKGATIDLGAADSVGVKIGDSVLSSSSTSALIDDVTIEHAGLGVSLYDAYNFKIRRLVSHAGKGVALARANGTISSSLILPSSVAVENNGGYGISSTSDLDLDSFVRVDNCTIVGPGSGSTPGITGSSQGTGTSVTLNVNSSIITGFGVAATGSAGSGATTDIPITYSRYAGSITGASLGTGTQSTIDFGFADPANGDYRLTLASPLVDAGDPAALDSTDSGSDADGKPRVVSRGAGNIRDIGAYEVQNTAPTAKIQVVTAVPSTTSTTEFSAAGSSDAENDALTYDWKFDGTPGASGITTKKMFIADGPHSVQLTVTDKTGASTTATAQFNVARGFLAIKLRSQDARLSTKGTFKITMSCPAEAISNCTGRLLFQTTKKVNAQNYTKRPGWVSSKPAYLQAARYVFSIAPGTTQKLEVRTYSTFQNILGVHKKFKIQSTLVSGTTSNANLTANRATFTVSAPKSSK